MWPPSNVLNGFDDDAELCDGLIAWRAEQQPENERHGRVRELRRG